MDLGIEVGEREINDIALEVGERCMAMFGQQDGELAFAQRAPEPRKQIWRDLGIFPRGIDREVVETMHRTSIGVDQQMENIMLQGSRCALADGWGGSMIATDLQDIMFGTPTPIAGEINLGVLKEDHVNMVIHGHEPVLPEMILLAAELPEMQEKAKSVGRQGHQPGRHLLHRQRDPHAPRHAHRRQRAPAGAGHPHRRGGRHGRGRAVRLPGHRPDSPAASTPR